MRTTTRRIGVDVHADDPLSRAGVTRQLGASPELDLSPTSPADVAIVVADVVDAPTVCTIRSIVREGTNVLLVIGQVDDSAVLLAAEAGAVGILRRQEASHERLVGAVRAAAAGEGVVSPDLVTRLLLQIGRLQREVLGPRGLRPSGLTDREVRVLQLVADGLSTSEIAVEMSYSERTIKNVVQNVVRRFGLRNRAHAVAFALREGLI